MCEPEIIFEAHPLPPQTSDPLSVDDILPSIPLENDLTNSLHEALLEKTKLKKQAIENLKMIDQWYQERRKKWVSRYITPANLKILEEDSYHQIEKTR